jgi:ribonuclease D
VGFDTETKPARMRGEWHPICLVQLSTPSFAVLFRISPAGGLPAGLREILEDADVTLVGQEIVKELPEITQTYGVAVPPERVVELSHATRSIGCLCKGVAGYAAPLPHDPRASPPPRSPPSSLSSSLSALVWWGRYAASLLGIRLWKTKALQLSNWEAAHLSRAQLTYAATDAWVCWMALEVVESLELLQQCRKERPGFFLDPRVHLVSATPAGTPASDGTGASGQGVPNAPINKALMRASSGAQPSSDVEGREAEGGQGVEILGRERKPRPRRRQGVAAEVKERHKILCKFFSAGTCRKGDACPFAHTDPSQLTAPSGVAQAEVHTT